MTNDGNVKVWISDHIAYQGIYNFSVTNEQTL